MMEDSTTTNTVPLEEATTEPIFDAEMDCSLRLLMLTCREFLSFLFGVDAKATDLLNFATDP